MKDQQQDWREAMQRGDRDVFQAAIAPFMDTLLAAARRDLQYYTGQGDIHMEDFTPEEIVGEGLVQAWERRDRMPNGMSLRGWLLAVQHRAARGLVARQRRLRRDEAVSLDAPVPMEARTGDVTQEWFYEWYQPDQVVLWEDITPGVTPVDIEVPLDGPRADILKGDARHVLTMHHEFEMPLEEVAFTLGRSLNELADLIEGARATLRERAGSDGQFPEPDPQFDGEEWGLSDGSPR